MLLLLMAQQAVMLQCVCFVFTVFLCRSTSIALCWTKSCAVNAEDDKEYAQAVTSSQARLLLAAQQLPARSGNSAVSGLAALLAQPVARCPVHMQAHVLTCLKHDALSVQTTCPSI
jgi:hypothetical protein